MPEGVVGILQAEQLPASPIGARTLDEAFPHPPSSLLNRVRLRQQAMSADEIDAAVAAIIAQARHAERREPPPGAAPDTLMMLAEIGSDPIVDEALRQRRDRDRAWLIGGIVCCILLIIVALVISRTMSVGMLRQ